MALAVTFEPKQAGLVCMPSSPNSICEGIMFLGCPLPHLSVHLTICLSGLILLPWYLMNGLSDLDETYSE